MNTSAVVIEAPGTLTTRSVALVAPGDADIVVEVEYSGISTGTERLLWNGTMPDFPGMGYPLVPGYETVGTVVEAGPSSGRSIGERVFVPGAHSFSDIRSLFGGAAATLVTAGSRTFPCATPDPTEGALLALAATACHAVKGDRAPELIVGHGVLGRLLARVLIAQGRPAPTVWEINASRREGDHQYPVCHPDDDEQTYSTICDVSGDSTILDTAIARLNKGGEVVLAGFYDKPLQFAFAPAFMREARIRVAAEWQPSDMKQVMDLLHRDQLSLANLITHQYDATRADAAYHCAFSDPSCLKMILNWKH